MAGNSKGITERAGEQRGAWWGCLESPGAVLVWERCPVPGDGRVNASNAAAQLRAGMWAQRALSALQDRSCC